MNGFARYVPWCGLALGFVYLAMAATPPSEPEGQMRLDEFGKLPVLEHGRVKPIDTLARTSLMVISGKQTYRDEEDREQPAVKWLLEVATSTTRRETKSEKLRSFSVENAQLRDLLGLAERPDALYSFEELEKKGEVLIEEATRAKKVDATERSDYDRALIDLANQAAWYAEFRRYETPYEVFKVESDQLVNLLNLKPRSGLRYGYHEIVPRVAQIIQESDRARKIEENDKTVFDTKVLDLANRVKLYVGLARLESDTLHVVPPAGRGEEWGTFTDALRARHAEQSDSPHGDALINIVRAYAAGNVKDFNKEVAAYRKALDRQMPETTSTAGFEVFFNHFAPFYHCAALYVLVFVLGIAAWVAYPEVFNRTAFWLAVLALAVHTWALIARMYIQGRPPVTNLYSSAVFIGWGSLVLCLILEAIYRNGFGTLTAAVTGFLTMLIAHHLALSGDTLEMMRAVLDTNFWLATHVVCITLGYTATFVAGFLGIGYVVLGLLTTRLQGELRRSLGQMIYGVVCFATFLSFVGTVLGGIWADQSWGRFWGWDPKENGALLIVIMNALILHARWGGIVKQRGVALLAIAGNMVTGWSWFGTNQLSIGLHAYGFNRTLADGLAVFWGTQLLFIAAGLVPLKYWRSFAPAQPPAADRPGAGPKAKLEPAGAGS